MVERTIQTVKRALKKSKFNHEDPYLALLHLRTTPIRGSLSPSAHLMKRRLRTLIPAIDLQPSATSRTLPELSVGDTVRFRADNRWGRRGVVLNKVATSPRSYNLLTDKLTQIRRNRRHLLRTQEQFIPQTDKSIEDEEEYKHQQDHQNEQSNSTNENKCTNKNIKP